MRCFGCNREIEVGDHYIEDKASGFLGHDPTATDMEVDNLIGELFSGRADGKVVFCTDCTQPGGDYKFETYYGDEDED